jgi:hypothetical protein
MSGGHFNYKQWHISEIADSIERIVENNGRKKTQEELKEESWHGDDWYERYPEDLHHYKYPDEVIEKFKDGITILKQAAIYAHRIDWLISGDDGNESFIERLQNDLMKLKGGNNG